MSRCEERPRTSRRARISTPRRRSRPSPGRNRASDEERADRGEEDDEQRRRRQQPADRGCPRARPCLGDLGRARHRQSFSTCAASSPIAMPTVSPTLETAAGAARFCWRTVKLLAAVQPDMEMRVGAEIDDVLDRAGQIAPCRLVSLACSGLTTTVALPLRLEALRQRSRRIVAPDFERHASPCRRPTRDRPRRQEIGFADEVGDEALGRLVVDVPRRADLQDLARRHHRDAVRHGQRLFLVVGDEDEGDAGLVLQPLQLDLHLLAQLEVERRQRLVEQQHLRAAAPARGPAPRAAAGRRKSGWCGGSSAPPSCTSFSISATRASTSALGLPSISRPKPIFSADRHVREQRIVLEDGVDRPLERRQRRDVLAVEQDLALGRESRSRRSAAAAWSCRSRTARAA